MFVLGGGHENVIPCYNIVFVARGWCWCYVVVVLMLSIIREINGGGRTK